MIVKGPSKPSRVRHSSWRRLPAPSRSAVCGLGGISPAVILSSILFPLDRLEQRAEVAAAEAPIALALDDLEEERSGLPIVVQARRLLEEDLQHVFSALAAVDQDAELAKHVDALLHLPDPDALEALRQHVVVGAGCRHELDAPLAQPAHRPDDVRDRQRRMLNAVAAVVLREQVDLRFL